MHSFVILILSMLLLHPTANGIHYRNFLNEASLFEKKYDESSDTLKPTDFNAAGDILGPNSETSELYYNASEFRSETSLELLTNESSSQTDQTNSTLPVSDPSQTIQYSTDIASSFSSNPKVVTLTGIFSNESQSPSSSSISNGEGVIATDSVVSLTQEVNGTSLVTSNGDEEPEGVARGKPFSTESSNATTSKPETIYQKTLALISDTYTLSILVPVAAGIVFASSIIVTIATCRCLRRRCRRRRLCRKVLPDSVKNLRPSDRARLLAESSDEEF